MSDVETVVEKKVTENLNIKEPEKYQVIFVNDNFTPMEFVVKVLMSVFHHTLQDAEKIMIDIHEKGKGTAGIFFYEIAEQKAIETTNLARSNGHPLNVEVETA
jgi:ATP-dependent Clp protease adaptor protein ClpS|tara:strand:+ start:19490 stop:19798 length:309 start_codon:yes stop_codon:yes gene_type:complete